jgi:hypothetical protein
MKRLKAPIVAGLIVVAAVIVHAQTDAHVGTWKMNAAKSKLAPDSTVKSQTRTYAMYGDGLKGTVDSVNADGSKTTTSYSAHFDGKPYPYSGNPSYDTIVLKKVDASTFEGTLTKSGKVIQTVTNAVSKDGKVMTVTANGTTGKGQKFTSVTVLEKQ